MQPRPRRLAHILIVVFLLLTPLGCATSKHTVQEETKIEQKKDGAFMKALKFIGAICLFGLIQPPQEEKETEYIYDLRDSYYNTEPSYKKEK